MGKETLVKTVFCCFGDLDLPAVVSEKVCEAPGRKLKPDDAYDTTVMVRKRYLMYLKGHDDCNNQKLNNNRPTKDEHVKSQKVRCIYPPAARQNRQA